MCECVCVCVCVRVCVCVCAFKNRADVSTVAVFSDLKQDLIHLGKHMYYFCSML